MFLTGTRRRTKQDRGIKRETPCGKSYIPNQLKSKEEIEDVLTFFHHNHPVTAITDFQFAQCDNSP